MNRHVIVIYETDEEREIAERKVRTYIRRGDTASTARSITDAMRISEGMDFPVIFVDIRKSATD